MDRPCSNCVPSARTGMAHNAALWSHWIYLRLRPQSATLAGQRLCSRNTMSGQARALHRHYRHLEVSQWQGFVRAPLQRFLINNQSQLCLTRDSVQYNAEQLEVLRRLLPQLCDDFQTAARSAQHMTEKEQDTMTRILAWEQKDMEDSPQQPHNDGMDEVDSHDLSPCATTLEHCLDDCL